MDNNQIIKMISDELQKITDQKFIVTVYLFVRKFNLKGGN